MFQHHSASFNSVCSQPSIHLGQILPTSHAPILDIMFWYSAVDCQLNGSPLLAELRHRRPFLWDQQWVLHWECLTSQSSHSWSMHDTSWSWYIMIRHSFHPHNKGMFSVDTSTVCFESTIVSAKGFPICLAFSKSAGLARMGPYTSANTNWGWITSAIEVAWSQSCKSTINTHLVFGSCRITCSKHPVWEIKTLQCGLYRICSDNASKIQNCLTPRASIMSLYLRATFSVCQSVHHNGDRAVWRNASQQVMDFRTNLRCLDLQIQTETWISGCQDMLLKIRTIIVMSFPSW